MMMMRTMKEREGIQDQAHVNNKYISIEYYRYIWEEERGYVDKCTAGDICID